MPPRPPGSCPQGDGLDWGRLGAELATGAGYAVLAVILLAVFERGSRRRATLDLM
ncbi:hypothetical protein [Streptomyces sp. NPDC051286]|uniref:hypothetical protein n=1 Tax=Streptomyces sp. NPDC051286 TaxID=3365647 RepID=UPI00379D6947